VSRSKPPRAIVSARMWLTPLSLSSFSLGLSCAVQETSPTLTQAAELYGTSCVGCHVPPDPRFEVERAWLEQVRDTA